eukprot:6930709-Pyramimonas_sp.AAC.1
MSEEVGAREIPCITKPSPSKALMRSWRRLSTRSFDIPKTVIISQYGRAMGSSDREGAGQAFDMLSSCLNPASLSNSACKARAMQSDR